MPQDASSPERKLDRGMANLMDSNGKLLGENRMNRNIAPNEVTITAASMVDNLLPGEESKQMNIHEMNSKRQGEKFFRNQNNDQIEM